MSLGDALGSLLNFGTNWLTSEHAMDWQAHMAGTRYQRTAADLQQAGLNRVLAYGDPGGVPSGIQAQMPDLSQSMSTVSNARTTAKVGDQQIKLSDSQIGVNEADILKSRAAADASSASAVKDLSQAALNSSQQKLTDWNSRLGALEFSKQNVVKGLYDEVGPKFRDFMHNILNPSSSVRSVIDFDPKHYGNSADMSIPSLDALMAK